MHSNFYVFARYRVRVYVVHTTYIHVCLWIHRRLTQFNSPKIIYIFFSFRLFLIVFDFDKCSTNYTAKTHTHTHTHSYAKLFNVYVKSYYYIRTLIRIILIKVDAIRASEHKNNLLKFWMRKPNRTAIR